MQYLEAIHHRRSYYSISSECPVSGERLEELLRRILLDAPSAFHSQSARVLLLLGESHAKVWNLTLEILRARVMAEKFAATEKKIAGFAAGHGTILFFEDMDVVRGFQEKFPSYKDNFPVWSLQSSGMLQFAVWTALESEGLGASLQHYNPLIDADVARAFSVPESWKLLSQMPFGAPTAEPAAKTCQPLDARLKIFR